MATNGLISNSITFLSCRPVVVVVAVPATAGEGTQLESSLTDQKPKPPVAGSAVRCVAFASRSGPAKVGPKRAYGPACIIYILCNTATRPVTVRRTVHIHYGVICDRSFSPSVCVCVCVAKGGKPRESGRDVVSRK